MATVVETISELRARCDEARARGGSVGFVPTMGYLHEGHVSLLREARRRCELVVLSIFVNPTQFAPGEDLDRYPRDLQADLAVASRVGVDVVFVPSVREMYPRHPATTTVHVEGPSAGLCGAARPTHFDGVATVVTKLFSIVGPCTAFFGRKDAQQLAVVKRLVEDLDLPVEVVGCPLVREADGVALSSRNAFLSPEERRAATVLYRALGRGARAVEDGERDPEVVAALVRREVTAEPLVELEYAEVRDAATMAPVPRIVGEVVVATAARVGATRLIDNVRVVVAGSRVDTDLGVGVAGH